MDFPLTAPAAPSPKFHFTCSLASKALYRIIFIILQLIRSRVTALFALSSH